MNTYEEQGSQTYKVEDSGERVLLANFTARIIRETRYVDGKNTETILTISGETPNRDPDKDPVLLPAIDVQAAQFAGLQWIMTNWGVRTVVQPGGSTRDDLRTAIQLQSDPLVTTIYRHTGWTMIRNKRTFLHANGGITANGNDPKVQVQLPPELAHYAIDCEDDVDIKEAVTATLELVTLAPADVSWPLLAGIIAPALGPVDFAIHVTGRTGTFKSELISLFQSHYGSGMDARHLPGSWSSTANALEAQAFVTKNAPFVIDDFVPSGTSWQVRTYQTTADKIIRSQGNQSGRARLTDTSSLQTAMYPRGIILSTGEDTPEGHSVRARMMILELSPGDIDPVRLTAAQKNRCLYPATMLAFLTFLAASEPDISGHAEQIRNDNLEIGHTRTPSMLGRLVASLEVFLDWAEEVEAITDNDCSRYKNLAHAAMLKAADNQTAYLESADPCDVFCATVRSMMGANVAHFRTLNGGIPASPTLLGWTEERSQGDLPSWKSHGPCIGWVDWNEDEMYLDITAGYNAIKKAAGAEIPLTKQTLMKRLKDASLLTRTDEARQRNTIRITAEKHPRQVLSLPISTVLDTEEKPNESADPDAFGP